MVITPRLVLGIDELFLHGDGGLGWLGIGSAGTATGIGSCWTARALFSLRTRVSPGEPTAVSACPQWRELHQLSVQTYQRTFTTAVAEVLKTGASEAAEVVKTSRFTTYTKKLWRL